MTYGRAASGEHGGCQFASADGRAGRSRLRNVVTDRQAPVSQQNQEEEVMPYRDEVDKSVVDGIFGDIAAARLTGSSGRTPRR